LLNGFQTEATNHGAKGRFAAPKAGNVDLTSTASKIWGLRWIVS